jgi:phage terminase large subunit GpA-like protein
MTAEYLTDAMIKGRRLQKWVEAGPNHLLDCRVYAKAMAEYLGLSRMSEQQWARLRAERGAPPGADTPDLFAVVPQTEDTRPQGAQARAAAAAPGYRGRGTRSRGIDI